MKNANFHDIPEMRHLLADMGPKIFHYTTAEGLLGIIGSKSMYASGVVHLNDATELEYSNQVILEAIEGFDPGGDELAARALSKLKDLWIEVGGVSQGQFVLSFSKTDDDAGQWERYAGPTGFVIGFDGFELVKVFTSQGLFFPVSYDGHQQTAIVNAILSQYLADPDTDLGEVETLSGDPLASFYLFNALLVTSRLFKHQAFRSESEVRFVQSNLFVSDTELFHKVGPYGLAAYKEISLLDPNGLMPITDIVYPFTGEPDELGWTIALLIHKHRDHLGDVTHRSTTFKLRSSPRR